MIPMLWYMWLNESSIYILKVEKVDLLHGPFFWALLTTVDCIRKVGKIPILPTFCKKIGKVEVGYLPTFEKKSR